MKVVSYSRNKKKLLDKEKELDQNYKHIRKEIDYITSQEDELKTKRDTPSKKSCPVVERKMLSERSKIEAKLEKLAKDKVDLIREFNKYGDEIEENVKQKHDVRTKFDECVSKGWCTDFSPKLFIGHFNTGNRSLCCLELEV